MSLEIAAEERTTATELGRRPADQAPAIYAQQYFVRVNHQSRAVRERLVSNEANGPRIGSEVSWAQQLERDRQALSSPALSAGVELLRLLDTIYREEAMAVVASLPETIRLSTAGHAAAFAQIQLLRHDRIEARRWFVRAQALARPDEDVLAARIALELGDLHLSWGGLVAADTVLAWSEAFGCGERGLADHAHLQALVAQARGQHLIARPAYRRALTARRALTPMTRVLATTNLAVALSHSYPAESVDLGALALDGVAAHQLDARARAPIENVLAYALLCAGRVGDGLATVQQARATAATHGSARIQRFARFNMAIALELLDQGATAVDELAGLREECISVGDQDLARWCAVRLAWLGLGRHGAEGVEGWMETGFGDHLPQRFGEAADVLRGIAAYRSRDYGCALTRLRRSYGACADRGEELTAFVILLWIACAEDGAGRPRKAAAAVEQACALGHSRGFRVSPNWWAPDVVRVAREHAGPFREYVANLLIGSSTMAVVARPVVSVGSETEPQVDGQPLDPLCWREGRTGSRVLRSLFGLLVASDAGGVARDDIVDALWPDSDGDRAVANLYAATNDLRRVLRRLPGVSLDVDRQHYALRYGPNVRHVR